MQISKLFDKLFLYFNTWFLYIMKYQNFTFLSIRYLNSYWRFIKHVKKYFKPTLKTNFNVMTRLMSIS